MQKRKIFIVMMLTVFCFGILTAGGLEENLSLMLENNAEMYVQPLVTGFGSSMNSGLYKRAKCTTGKLPLPIGFDVNIIVSASLVPDEDLNYDYYFMDNTIDFDLQNIDASLPNVTMSMSDLYTADKEETPTISGDEEGAVITPKTQSDVIDALIVEMDPANSTEETAYRAALNSAYESSIEGFIPEFQFPDGSNIPAIPSTNVQLNVRIPFGIELGLRGAPPYEIPDVGKFKMLGFGVRKNIPVPIVDVAVGGFYQILTIGDVFEAKNINVHTEIGKTLGIPGFKISPYLGVGMDKSTVDLTYTILGGTIPGNSEDQEIEFNMEGENKFRTNLGFSLQIALLHLQGEYSIGKYQSATLNVGLTFK
ncbi:MAG: hypothetical protein PF551_04605 [Candidatus Marinimicrobia bacterium]|jgi:hypothetical protein|nr:hypothetical protein [Candidatus Neomarinimicrobiota bacterium]